METSKFKNKPIRIQHYHLKLTFTIAIAIVAIIGCTKKQAQEPSPEPPNETVTVENVSYTNFAKAIFEAKCSSCHASGRSASGRWTFSGYSSVKDNITNINNAVLVVKSMPIGGSLTAKEMELLGAWVKRNIPEN